jgi:hypothetical protein
MSKIKLTVDGEERNVLFFQPIIFTPTLSTGFGCPKNYWIFINNRD